MLHSASPTRRQLFALGAGGAAAAALAGCGGSSSGSGDSITYWSNWKEGESQQAVLAEAISAFETESGITVDVEWQGRQVTQKIVPVLNTPQVPDIVDAAYGKLAPVLAETGQVHPLDDLFASDVEGEAITDLIPEKFRNESTMIDGSPLAAARLPHLRGDLVRQGHESSAQRGTSRGLGCVHRPAGADEGRGEDPSRRRW